MTKLYKNKNYRKVFSKIFYSQIEPYLSTPDCEQRRIIIWGCGAAAKTFLEILPLDVDYFVQTETNGEKEFYSRPILPCNVLVEEPKDQIIVLVLSMFYEEISRSLSDMGLRENYSYILPVQIAPSHIILYAKDKNDHQRTVDWLNQNIEYARLRWFDNFVIAKEDWDILVSTSQLEKLYHCPYLNTTPSDYAFDFKWGEPVGFVDEQLYYPKNIGEKILKSRCWDKMGFYRVAHDIYPLVFSYHVLFQKNEKTTQIGWSKPDDRIANKFSIELQKLLPINSEISLDTLWDYLYKNDWLPPIGDGRRWAVKNRSRYLANKLKVSMDNQQLFALLVRKAGDNQGNINHIMKTGSAYNFKYIGSYFLSSCEIQQLKVKSRGGMWNETTASEAAGGPVRIIFLWDSNADSGINTEDIFDFTISHWRSFKNEIRTELKGTTYDPSTINWLHSADDHRESMEMLFLLNDGKREEVLSKIDVLKYQ